MSSTKIKICGLTSSKESIYLNRNQVDFAGMVLFFPKSRRNISIETAEKIMSALNPEIRKVAVTVSPSADEIRAIEKAGFDYIQIHGEISDDLFRSITIPVLKAFNVSDMDSFSKYSSDPNVAGYVFDAQEPGSGKTFDWDTLKEIPRDNKLLILAGGLNSENVSKAVLHIHPDVVDVSSGVEYESGTGKDPEKIALFVNNVRVN